jgi:hypothetical protein
LNAVAQYGILWITMACSGALWHAVIALARRSFNLNRCGTPWLAVARFEPLWHALNRSGAI